MLRINSAAQFAPFAVLTGYKDAVEETARVTQKQITLDETEIERINETLYNIANHLSQNWNVAITYFIPDSMKNGGTYLTDVGLVKKIDAYKKIVQMDSGIIINMEQIIEVNILL